MTLPDGWRFRVNWRGKLILQRRFRFFSWHPMDWVIRWRDADVEDLKVIFGEIK